MAGRMDERDADLSATAERLVDIATELLTVARELRARGPGPVGPGSETGSGGLDPDDPIEELIEPLKGEDIDT